MAVGVCATGDRTADPHICSFGADSGGPWDWGDLVLGL